MLEVADALAIVLERARPLLHWPKAFLIWQPQNSVATAQSLPSGFRWRESLIR